MQLPAYLEIYVEKHFWRKIKTPFRAQGDLKSKKKHNKKCS
jgi:hypothetical protein